MTAMRVLGLASAAAAAMFLAAGAAQAHDPRGKGGPSPEIAKRIAEGRAGMLAMDSSEAAKGIYARSIQWPPSYAKLRVCFMGGEDANNAKVAEIADQWSSDGAMGLKLDFGKMAKPRKCDPKAQRESQIRVSYDQSGYFSVVGQVSVVYLKQEEASLNLEGMGDMKLEGFDDPEIQGTILHEFGHALGLLHEHQSPVSDCANEFDWDYLNKSLGGPPNNWDADTIKTNLGVESGDDLMSTDFDPKSIMLYYFPPEYYKDGKKASCYIAAPNNTISEADRGTIDYMYPADQAQREANYAQAKSAMQAIVDKSAASGTKGVDFDYLGAFFGGKGVAADEQD